ncbi:hypothetical protein HPB49_020883 [Dermacentor silvarum]|uniref:Uncharacterized protein n=1 Tax=Dermacentor silvarum TaxID=543639 RepID=A0ACB8DG39_DERSI|nr:hypothetical protein HPB49_020883 [Dermacentor silvarum]
MSEESSTFLHKIYARRSALATVTLTKSISKGTAVAIFSVLSLLGVCGTATVLTLVVRQSGADVTEETVSPAANRSLLPVAPLRRDAAPPQSVPDELHGQPMHSASLSTDEIQGVVQKHGKKVDAARKETSAPAFPGRKARTKRRARTTPDGAAAAAAPATQEHNATHGAEKKAPALITSDGDYYGANGFNESAKNGGETAVEGSDDLELHQESSSGQTSSSSPFQESSARQSSTAGRTNTAASTEVFPASFKISEPPTKAPGSSQTSSGTHLVGQADIFDPKVDGEAKAAERKSRSSSRLLFCFYDDRSAIRSPGFSVYDFPVQLCTDVAFCCVDVNVNGRVVVSRKLKLFLEVMRHEFLPPSHLFVTLGGHRVLVHHLDTALGNTARFATELSEELQRMGAGGLAVYIEDVEPLKHAFRVHDLLMAVRGVSVAVVLPRDLQQQVRYYRTEIYANTKDMLVISPPSQGYGGRQPRPAFATCPHPRRSVREGSSLEFIYQLSRTLLSSMAEDAVDYTFGGAASMDELTPVPRYLIGVSFGGLKFQLKNRSRHDVGSPATFVRTVPYREICRQRWQHWHDNVSECFVAWDGDRGWMSSLGPQSTGFTSELANGLAVFDLDLDDYLGECGNKFPVLRALRTALTARRVIMPTT